MLAEHIQLGWWGLMSERRVGSEHSAVRANILVATEMLIVEQGYGAVSARAVAAKAGVKPAVLQYYFPKMDDLWSAVYLKTSEAYFSHQMEAVASGDPARALWEATTDAHQTALGLEYMGAASHREKLRKEISEKTERVRILQAGALSSTLRRYGDGRTHNRALGVAFLITAISRSLVMERGLGLVCGHDEATEIVEHWLEQLGSPPPKGKETRRRRSRTQLPLADERG
jgi:AcrR family transcriptional regulator